jgi:RNA recognition motif-containing protein
LTLVKVLRDTSNRPYAFVQYTNDADANKALKEGQHSILDGRAIRCERAKVNRTLYIGTGDGNDISLRQIKESLYQYGEIEQMVGNNDSPYRKSNLNKAWFCKFAYREDAIRAYANLRLSPDWIVEWAQNIEHPSDVVDKPSDAEVVIDKFSIFVGQLDDKVTKEKLDVRFSRHGKLSEITLVLRPGNNFAFIKFETEKAAAAAVERENHAVFLDKTMHVQYRELHHRRSRYSSASSTSPRLSLAPPPVNLPYRRASTGSGPGFNGRQHSVLPNMYQPLPRTNRSSKYPNSRSISYTPANERISSQRYHTPSYGFPPGFQEPLYNEGETADEDSAYSPSQKHSPISSPSDNTVGSAHGESKSLYSSSTVSGQEHNNDDCTEPTTSGHGTTKYQSGRNFGKPNSSHPPVQLMRPPSSYYYYPVPTAKENYVYDQNQCMAFASYPYYINESYVDFPQTALGANEVSPVPYYMFYGDPATGTGYNEVKVKPYEKFEHNPKHDEMDY